MALTKEHKLEIRSEYGLSEADTGSSQVQVAALTARIKQLVEHLRTHKHDFSTQHGLLKLVGRRRRLLAYMRKHEPDNYTSLIQRLGLRR